MTLTKFTEVVRAAEWHVLKAKELETDAVKRSVLTTTTTLPGRRKRFKTRSIANLRQTCYLAGAVHLTRACEPLRDARLYKTLSHPKEDGDNRG